MGLFGFGKKKQESAQQQQLPPIMVAPWQMPPATKVYRLPAEHESNIYTYNGTPFKGVPANTRFVVTAMPAEVRMESIYNGSASATVDRGDVAYAFNGQPFGFASSHAEAVRKLMQNGYIVEVEAYISGYDGELGFPKVRGLFGFVDDDLYKTLQ